MRVAQTGYWDYQMTCLANRDRAFVSNVDSSDLDMDERTDDDLDAGCSGSLETRKCFTISNLSKDKQGYDLNGLWEVMPDECYNGESVYRLFNPNQPTFYMFREKPWYWVDKWAMAQEI